MDARRLELYELLKPKLDEQSARALVLALPPDAERLATKDDLVPLKGDIALLRGELVALEERLIGAMDVRSAQLESTLTRRMVTIMGAWTILFGSSIGWAMALVR